jgi:hypothetical protein
VADLANRLKQGQHIKIKHGLMQRKSGELYSLKHAVHLSHGKKKLLTYYLLSPIVMKFNHVRCVDVCFLLE